MRHTALDRTKILGVALAAALGGALVSHTFWAREAQAQGASSISTIYVPADGVVFRSFDGRPIARLSRDAHGGLLEVYDDHDEATVRVSSGTFAPFKSSGIAPTGASRIFTLDDQDPWLAAPPNPAPRPGAGF
jgi:hypothetical protein